jgi:hypothetical protein
MMRGAMAAVMGLALVAAPAWTQAPGGKGVAVLKAADGKGKPVEVEVVFGDGRLGFVADGAPDLKKLEADLAQKVAEIEAVKRKIAELKAAADAKRQLEAARARLAETMAKTKEAEARKTAAPGGLTVTIQISGAKAEDVEALVKKLREAVGGAAIRITKGPEMKEAKPADRRVIILGDSTGVLRLMPSPLPPAVPAPPGSRDYRPVPAPPLPMMPGTRARSVEDRLDALMKELEALRREIKGGTGARPGTTPR